MGDWMELRADYFEQVAREVFDQYLGQYGFGRGEADEAGCLTYRRRKVFLHLNYFVEDSPKYSPMVNIGLADRAHYLTLDRIGLWYAIPEGSELRFYEDWRYSNADELKSVLTRIRDEVVDVYARPLWENAEKLAELIASRLQEVKAERQAGPLRKRGKLV
jgi:hypothetical protein